MANFEETVEVIFSGMDDVSKMMAIVIGSQDRFASRAQSVAQPLADWPAGVLETQDEVNQKRRFENV